MNTLFEIFNMMDFVYANLTQKSAIFIKYINYEKLIYIKC